MWDARAIVRVIAALDLAVEPEPYRRDFLPPRVLVVITAYDEAAGLEKWRPWLSECAHLVFVRDGSRDRVPADPELQELIEQEWRDALASLPDPTVFDWFGEDPAPCREAIELAIARASTLVARPSPAPRANPDLELPMSAWLAWTGPTYWPRASLVAVQLAMREDRAALIDAHGDAIDLAAPRAPIELAIPLASRDSATAGRYPRGTDPIHPIGWRGHRMAIYWSYVGARETGFLSATDHDWPCGPAKKLWGYANNDPVAVAVTPAADACAQFFEHDVLVTGNVPIAWHRSGAVDVAAFVRDPRRAALYAQTAEFQHRATEDLLDEDNRELAPALVLGPSAAVRYAVALDHRVIRIRGEHDTATADRVGGPGGGFVVCDADHQVVRRGTGTLLGGWYRHATIEDAGMLWREDLATGARTLLGSAARVACVDPEVEAVVQDAIREGRHDAAGALRANHPVREITGALEVVAIPGTRNILEIAGDVLRVV